MIEKYNNFVEFLIESNSGPISKLLRTLLNKIDHPISTAFLNILTNLSIIWYKCSSE